MRKNLKNLVQDMKREDYILLFVILAYFLFTLFLILGFKQLPSPLYGGDYYHSMGAVNHFKYGGNAFKSESLIGSLPHYFPFYTILVGGLSILFSLQTFLAMKIFAIIEVILAVLIFYLLGKKVFKNKWLALISVLLYLSFATIRGFPVWKYLQFSITLVFPLVILSFLYFYNKQDMKSAVFAGLMLGIMGISHSVGFVSTVFFVSIFSIYMLFFQYLQKKEDNEGKGRSVLFFNKESFKKSFFKILKLLFIIFIIGFIIAQLYWFKPLFVHHGKTLNSLQDYAQNDFSTFGNTFSFIKTSVLNTYFFNFKDAYLGLRSLLFIAGIITFLFLKKHTSETRFLGIILLTSIVGTFHFIITQPLFGTVLSPHYISCFTFILSCALFGTFAIKVLANTFKKYRKFILPSLFVLLLTLNLFHSYNYQKNDRWVNVGRSPLHPQFFAMEKWIVENTDVNDVFLTTNELGFALNALTGRKLATMRRGHIDLFTDMDKRMLDATIMLYGNDSVKREELLRQYNVKYLYWDNYWIMSDYRFDEQGKLIGVFDPLLVFKSEERLLILKKYNISFYEQHTWMDPAVRGDWVKKADFIFILPTQFNLTHPWHPDLDNYLEEAWNYTQNNQVIIRVYKIVNVD